MSFVQTLLNGEQGLFKPKTLTPMQKLTLRFVVVGLVYLRLRRHRGHDHADLRGRAAPVHHDRTSSSPS